MGLLERNGNRVGVCFFDCKQSVLCPDTSLRLHLPHFSLIYFSVPLDRAYLPMWLIKAQDLVRDLCEHLRPEKILLTLNYGKEIAESKLVIKNICITR